MTRCEGECEVQSDESQRQLIADSRAALALVELRRETQTERRIDFEPVRLNFLG